jgi:hypothetical protein
MMSGPRCRVGEMYLDISPYSAPMGVMPGRYFRKALLIPQRYAATRGRLADPQWNSRAAVAGDVGTGVRCRFEATCEGER